MKVSQVFWGFILIAAIFAGIEWWMQNNDLGSLLDFIPSISVGQ